MSIRFSGLASGLDTDSIIKDLMKVERMKVEKVEKDKQELEWKKEAWQEMNTKLYSFYTDNLFKLKSSGTFSKKEVTSSDTDVATVTATTSAVTGVHSLNVTQVAKGSFYTGNDLTSSGVTSATLASDLVTFPEGTTEIKLKVATSGSYSEVTINSTDTVSGILEKLRDADSDLNASFDTNYNRIFLSTKTAGDGKKVELLGGDDSTTLDEDLLAALGFDGTTIAATDGQNAEFTYNNVPLESTTNDVSVNGMSITIKSEGTTNIGVTQDSDAIYEEVKNIILKYNELLMDINEKLDAESERDYGPLTDEEKDAMSEDDIKRWEEKAKSDLLRNDSILVSVRSSMRSILTGSVGVDTTGMDNYKYLSDLGIVTGTYTEKGILHIQGDEDDSLYAIKDNKLKEAIEDDPEGVAEFLNALGSELYSTFADKMKSSTLSSALTFYNDKQINDKINDYEDRIYELEDYLISVEDRYYRQFTAMEQAIQQSNSTGDWLMQQLGGM